MYDLDSGGLAGAERSPLERSQLDDASYGRCGGPEDNNKLHKAPRDKTAIDRNSCCEENGGTSFILHGEISNCKVGDDWVCAGGRGARQTRQALVTFHLEWHAASRAATPTKTGGSHDAST